MPFTLTAQHFSDWEFCPRLVQLLPVIEPGAWPVRRALSRYLHSAIEQFSFGHPADRVAYNVPGEFLDEAGTRGFEHAIPVAEIERSVYTFMRDYACWLEGAIYLAHEVIGHTTISSLRPIYVKGSDVDSSCWVESDRSDHGHVFRIADRPSTSYSPHWPELLASLSGDLVEVAIHTFVLPAPTRDRIASPLCMAYAHPMTGQLRLATRGRETFSGNWKRLARWELNDTMPEFRWPEWRLGIERDECLGRCYSEDIVDFIEQSSDDRRQLLRDAELIVDSIGHPSDGIRKHELCGRCMMRGYCHGDEASRHAYRPVTCYTSSLISDPIFPAAPER